VFCGFFAICAFIAFFYFYVYKHVCKCDVPNIYGLVFAFVFCFAGLWGC